MKFLTTKEAADKWKISRRRVIRLAGEGRISGAYFWGKNWMIPAEANKPADGRTRQAKSRDGADSFRFPFYMNHEEDWYFPPLCEEEKILRQAQIDFFACHFEKAKAGFEDLKTNAKNTCIRITALFFLCYLSVNDCKGENFENLYPLLNIAIAEDQPHQREMKLLHPYLLGCLALYKSAAEYFHIDWKYEYSPSVYPLLSILFLLTKSGTCTMETLDALLDTYEITVRQLERDGSFYEAQMLHILLFSSYYFKANEKAVIYHLKKVLDIACKHQLIFPAADIFSYYADVYTEILKEYPADFSTQIIQMGKHIHQSFSVFMSKRKITDLYTKCSKTEYQYIFYASQGYSNKYVAEIMHLSERTVANRYALIYDKLEVQGKRELIKKLREDIARDII